MDGGVQFDPAEMAYRVPEPAERVYVGAAGEDLGLAALAAGDEGLGGGARVPAAGADALLGGGALLRGVAPSVGEDDELAVLLGR